MFDSINQSIFLARPFIVSSWNQTTSMGVGDGISSHLLPFKNLTSVRKKQPACVGFIWAKWLYLNTWFKPIFIFLGSVFITSLSLFNIHEITRNHIDTYYCVAAVPLFLGGATVEPKPVAWKKPPLRWPPGRSGRFLMDVAAGDFLSPTSSQNNRKWSGKITLKHFLEQIFGSLWFWCSMMDVQRFSGWKATPHT